MAAARARDWGVHVLDADREEEVDDLMVLGLSDDSNEVEDPEASYNHQQDETVHGSLTVWDLVMALVTGQS
jgi:hypothetical protein